MWSRSRGAIAVITSYLTHVLHNIGIGCVAVAISASPDINFLRILRNPAAWLFCNYIDHIKLVKGTILTTCATGMWTSCYSCRRSSAEICPSGFV